MKILDLSDVESCPRFLFINATAQVVALLMSMLNFPLPQSSSLDLILFLIEGVPLTSGDACRTEEMKHDTLSKFQLLSITPFNSLHKILMKDRPIGPLGRLQMVRGQTMMRR